MSLFLKTSRFALALGCAAMTAACGGGGSSTPTPSPSAGTPTPTPTTSACSLSARQDFVLAQLQEWYLFPDLIDTSINKASYNSVDAYLDALVAPARAQSKDRYFTYLTSIAEENAYYDSGSTAGFGIRLSYDSTANRVFVTEAFEGAVALGAGLDRGSELLEIQAPGGASQSVSALMASGGSGAVSDALGPSDPGVTRILTFSDPSGVVRSASLTKTDYTLDPVSDRYGSKVFTTANGPVGYLNLRTFIDTAEPDLTAAFDQFRQQGITRLIVDLRYNGGGLVSVAETLGDLMGAGKSGQIFDYLTYRPSKSSQNESYAFHPVAQSIQPTRIAFIGTGATASASELVINGMLPYLGSSMALIGSNTYGKPVGQIALDKSACDDRLRVVAFRVENATHDGDYYTGLADTLPVTCAATDDFSHPLGDPQEAMIAAALGYFEGRACTPISAAGARTLSLDPPQGQRGDGRRLLQRAQPSTFEREVPGAF